MTQKQKELKYYIRCERCDMVNEAPTTKQKIVEWLNIHDCRGMDIAEEEEES